MDGDYQVQRTVSITIIGGIFGEISIVNTDLSKLLEFFFLEGGGVEEKFATSYLRLPGLHDHPLNVFS